MDSHDNALLTATGPGTAMGRLLRRFWLPAVLSTELAEPDGAPVRVRLLGENLVAFRDSEGQAGLLRESCAHRGASLYYGQNGKGGLRCWYHGWKYDATGALLETPNEPGDALKQRVRQPAYPCVEINGAVWTYMGPPQSQPRIPDLEWLLVPRDHVYITKRIQQCHWTQGMEGDIDPSHLAFLHGETISQGGGSSAGHASANWLRASLAPAIEAIPRPNGILYASRREAGDADSYFWRIGQWMLPWFTTIPAFPGEVPMLGHAWVPRDDQSTAVFSFSWHPRRAVNEVEIARYQTHGATHAILAPGSFIPQRNKSTEYLDPAMRDAPQPWMRITRFQDQDIAATEGIGPTFDRSSEHLVSSDEVIARVRRTLMVAAMELESGGEAPGRDPADYRIRPYSVKLPRDVAPWHEAAAEAMQARPETFRASD